MIIYIARHGQTTGDIENRYGGDYDDHLTDEGKTQAAVLAQSLHGKGIENLYTSPRIRAAETASVVGEALDLPVTTLDAFRERNGYGILTGLTKEEAKEKFPDQVAIVKDVHAAVEGAEEYSDFQARIFGALDALGHSDAETVAVVTHGGPIKLIFRDILKQGEVDVEDCAFIVLEVNDGQYKLIETHGITFPS